MLYEFITADAVFYQPATKGTCDCLYVLCNDFIVELHEPTLLSQGCGFSVSGLEGCLAKIVPVLYKSVHFTLWHILAIGWDSVVQCITEMLPLFFFVITSANVD